MDIIFLILGFGVTAAIFLITVGWIVGLVFK